MPSRYFSPLSIEECRTRLERTVTADSIAARVRLGRGDFWVTKDGPDYRIRPTRSGGGGGGPAPSFVVSVGAEDTSTVVAVQYRPPAWFVFVMLIAVAFFFFIGFVFLDGWWRVGIVVFLIIGLLGAMERTLEDRALVEIFVGELLEATTEYRR